MWGMGFQGHNGAQQQATPANTLQQAPQPAQPMSGQQMVANAMMGAQTGDYSPIQSPFQGISHVAGDMMNGMAQHRYKLQHNPYAAVVPGNSGGLY